MNANVVLDDLLLAQAKALTGEDDRSVILDRALRLLVEHEQRQRSMTQEEAIEALAALGGSDPDAWAPGRRRFD